MSTLSQAREFREIRLMAGEKSFYKEINKAPEVRFPIKVDIALPAHKVSLVLQSELGNVALPDGEVHKKHHNQHRIDRTLVFLHATRLIRCLTDCRIQLEDAISARHALELGRSLAAHVWDNTASQLRQVEGLGEVAVRKLASASINSIDTLMNTEPSRIEMVLGKNPPFGHQLLKQLESFPNLRVSVKETSRDVRPGKGVQLRFNTDIGFLNHKIPFTFNKKQFSICFFIEDSNGNLVDFRRFSPKKLDGGIQMPLEVHLKRSTSYINCYVSCDDVAGTSRCAELKLSNIPDSIYPTLKPEDQVDNRDTSKSLRNDEFDDGGIDDYDLLAATAYTSTTSTVEDVDAVLAANDQEKSKKPSEPKPFREPVQLPNGRWSCAHECADRGLNCKHPCCHNGLEKKRKPPSDAVAKAKAGRGQKKIITMATVKPQSDVKDEKKLKRKPSNIPQVDNAHFAAAPPIRPPLSMDGESFSDIGSIPSDMERLPHKRAKISKSSKATSRKLSRTPSENKSIMNKNLDRYESAFKLRGPSHDGFKFFNDEGLFDEDMPEQLKPANIANQNPVSADVPTIQDRTSQPIDDDYDLEAPTYEDADWGALDTDRDLGLLEPPLEHVAMSDVVKKPVISTPLTNAMAQRAPSSTVMAPDRHGDIFEISTSRDTPVDASAYTNNTFMFEDGMETSTDVDSPAEVDVKTPNEHGITVSEPKPVAEPVAKERDRVETAAERRWRLHEEHQKKKWQGLDQWLYDEFHNCVEII
jgi:hypothetical protein